MDRSSHDPFAPSAAADPAPSYPEERLRRLGLRDDELNESRAGFEAMSDGEKREALEALAQLSDDELAAEIADRGEEPEALTGVVGPEGANASIDGGSGPTVTDTTEPASGTSLVGESGPEVVQFNGSAPAAEVATGGPGEAAETSGGDDPSEVTPSASSTPDGWTAGQEAEYRIADGATIAELEEWVADDADRARAVLDAEQARGEKARKTLIEAMEKLVGG